jgi:hypothetical protein
MKTFLFSALAVALLAAGSQSASAAHTMHSGMVMPKCSSSDPVVGVNMMSKMYMTHAQMKTKMAGMSNSKMHMMFMKNHVKLMCTSKAKAMGAKKMSPGM